MKYVTYETTRTAFELISEAWQCTSERAGVDTNNIFISVTSLSRQQDKSAEGHLDTRCVHVGTFAAKRTKL